MSGGVFFPGTCLLGLELIAMGWSLIQHREDHGEGGDSPYS